MFCFAELGFVIDERYAAVHCYVNGLLSQAIIPGIAGHSPGRRWGRIGMSGRATREGADPVLRRTRQRRHAVAGQGAEIIDSEGRRWLDASSSVFVAILGANPPGVAERIMTSMQQLQFSYSGQFGSAEEDELAAALIRRAPAGFGKVWLTTSGSAANESAVKLARQ